MNKKYEAPEAEIITFGEEDVILASGGHDFDED